MCCLCVFVILRFRQTVSKDKCIMRSFFSFFWIYCVFFFIHKYVVFFFGIYRDRLYTLSHEPIFALSHTHTLSRTHISADMHLNIQMHICRESRTHTTQYSRSHTHTLSRTHISADMHPNTFCISFESQNHVLPLYVHVHFFCYF